MTKKRAVLVVLSLVVFILFGASRGHFTNKTKMCQTLLKEANESLNSKHYSEAYRSLKPHTAQCAPLTANSIKGEEKQIVAVQYFADLAAASHNTGLKTEAYGYASNSIKVYTSMSPSSRAKVPSGMATILRMNAITLLDLASKSGAN